MTDPSGPAAVQYRVIFGKKDEVVDGPDDAAVVITVAAGDAAEAAQDVAVAYMRGRVKASGHTGVLFDELASGRAATAISRLASRP